MKAVWLTDIHLVFLRDPKSGEFDSEYFTFVSEVASLLPDCILITGDIGESPEVVRFLHDLATRFDCPIYFILGNHDFYRSSIAATRKAVEVGIEAQSRLVYLTIRGPVGLTSGVGLIGHDGWPDGRDGDYGCDGRQDLFNDFKYIEELKVAGKDPDYDRWPILKRLADEAVTHLEANLVSAVQQYRKVFVLTHFPPFRQAAFLKGRMVDAQQASRCVSKAVGDLLMRVAEENPDNQFTVLCGHMHSKAYYSPRENLVVHAGAATYGSPEVSAIFDF